MRGVGFECDSCGVRLVVDGDAWMDTSVGGGLPDGWVVIGPQRGNARHCCSWRCVERLALAVQAGPDD